MEPSFGVGSIINHFRVSIFAYRQEGIIHVTLGSILGSTLTRKEHLAC